MKIAIYARVSTKDKGQDVENQLLPLREEASRTPNSEVVEEYIEYESAAGKVKRKVWERMMADATSKPRAFDLLLFWSLDRFSREGAAPTLLALQRLTTAGVAWKSLREPLLDTHAAGPFKDVLVALMAAIAQLETQRRSERAKAAIARKRERGERLGKEPKKIPLDELMRLKKDGFSNSSLARYFSVSRATIINRIKAIRRKQEGRGKEKGKWNG